MLESVQNTNRKISRISVDFCDLTATQFRSTICIIEKHFSTIKSIKISRSTCPFLEIVSLLPNVEHLVVEELRTEILPTQMNHPIMPCNENPNLHQLKTVELIKIRHIDDCVVMVELGCVSENWCVAVERSVKRNKELMALFKRQTNIKKLTITDSELMLDNDIFDDLELESLDWGNAYRNIATILSKQTKLKSLKLNQVDERLMNIIVNQLTELETLSLDFHDENVPAFENIGKLTKLKDLTLHRIQLRNLTHFVDADNSRITSLEIKRCGDLTEDLIHALAKSAPNLNVVCLIIIIESRESFHAIMRNFNFVKVLKIENYFKNRKYNNKDIPLLQDECFNPMLIDLKIKIKLPYDTPFLNKLIANYPNLKKLQIESSTPLTSLLFKLLQNGFPKLEAVRLGSGASQLTADDFKCLKHGTNNLKFISVWDLGCAVRHEIKNCDLFAVKSEDYGLFDFGNFDVAADQCTMKCVRK